MYTVRDFRSKLSTALDEAKTSCVHIKRGDDTFELKLCTQNDTVCTQKEPIKTKPCTPYHVNNTTEKVLSEGDVVYAQKDRIVCTEQKEIFKRLNPILEMKRVYGCGCEKEDKNILCPEHQRV